MSISTILKALCLNTYRGFVDSGQTAFVKDAFYYIVPYFLFTIAVPFKFLHTVLYTAPIKLKTDA